MQNKKLFLILVILVAVVAVVYGFGFQPDYFNFGKTDPSPYQEDIEAIKKLEAAMKADTDGGKTPEETLKLFVAALKKQDVALASKYFLLDVNASREKWVQRLTDIKNKGLMLQMAEDIETKAKPGGSAYEDDSKFELFNDDGTLAVLIDMEFNKFSKVWKIESF